MAKIIFISLLLPFLAVCQVEKLNNGKDYISFSYNQSVYNKIAVDTIKSMYLNQKKMQDSSHSMSSESICVKYNLNDIKVQIIPKFRLKRVANELYSCDKNIEEFIEFEEKFKYMSVVLLKDNQYISMQTIPHPYFEIERINNPDFRLKVDKFVYEESILKNFMSNELYLANIQKDIEKRSGNFFFGIYGLWDVIFEIDIKTGILYANRYGYDKVVHMLANDYLRQYEGETKIKELARGYYEDIDGIETLESKPCDEITNYEKPKILKVITKDNVPN